MSCIEASMRNKNMNLKNSSCISSPIVFDRQSRFHLIREPCGKIFIFVWYCHEPQFVYALQPEPYNLIRIDRVAISNQGFPIFLAVQCLSNALVLDYNCKLFVFRVHRKWGDKKATISRKKQELSALLSNQSVSYFVRYIGLMRIYEGLEKWQHFNFNLLFTLSTGCSVLSSLSVNCNYSVFIKVCICVFLIKRDRVRKTVKPTFMGLVCGNASRDDRWLHALSMAMLLGICYCATPVTEFGIFNKGGLRIG
uniref:Uncharacterized protein n=1 Tax=Strigamia maritima TaxID=126957 RepID=T1J3D2_STRMM